MSLSAVTTLTQRELLDALRNKWFLVYSIAFVVLCFGLALMIVNSSGYAGISGFGRTAAEAHNSFGGEVWKWDSVFDVRWDNAPAPDGHGDDPHATPAEEHSH